MAKQRIWMMTSVLAFSLVGALPGWAQDVNPPEEPNVPQEANAPAPQDQNAPPQPAGQTAPVAPPSSGWHRFGEARPAPPLPATLNVPAGSWITVHVDQPLSSDQNQPGDFFSATLAQPLVVEGIVVARRGQTVGGVVAESSKGGRVKGTSRLGLQLTELTLVDGQQLPIKTRFIQRQGDTSVGSDAATIGTTTGIGAAIGAAADGGFGAGMGAIAGAAVSTIGVLVTRGRPTVVYPETLLTFRLEGPITVSTANAPEAFQPVRPGDYERRTLYRASGRPGPPPPPPYYYGGYYPYYDFYPPFFWGPSFFFYSGPRFYGGFHGGFHRGFRHR
jgi:hypothetical protein